MRFNMLLLSALVVVGCAKDSQNPEGSASFHLSIGDTDCLDSAGTKVQNFFSGDGTQADIHGVWTCATKILQDFTAYTQGARADGYTAAELQGFLSRYYFLNGISNDAINSTLKLKSAVVGGAGDFVTRAEIQKLISAIGVLDSATHDIFPVAKVLFTDSFLQTAEADWFAAHDVMSAAIAKVGTVLAQSGQNYAFADLQTLLQSWGAQLKLPSDHMILKVSGYVPVLKSGKALLVAGSASFVTAEEWQPLLATLSSAYSDYRMLLRVTPSSDKMALLTAARLPWLISAVVDLLDRGVGRHAGQQIPLSDIHNFLIDLEAQKFLPASITSAQATSALQFVLNKIFKVAAAPVDALSGQTVAELRRFVGAWNTYDAALVSQNFAGAAEFGAAFRPGGVALTFDGLGRLEFPAAHPAGVHHELSAIFAVLEWLGGKWGTWPVSQAVLDSIVGDCLTVLHNLSYLVDTDATISNKLMRDPNLFTLGANGDLKLDKFEAFQYGVYVLSAYRGKQQLDTAAVSCNAGVPCISNLWFQQRATLLANFPNLLSWLGSDATRWGIISQDLAKVVGADSWFQQFVVLHYIETFMQRFDQSGDQLINYNESMVGFPVFHPILSVLLPQNGLAESDVLPMYTYLLKFGNTPTNVSGGALAYYFWKGSPSSWVYNSDRAIIAGILAALGDITK